MKLQAIFAMSLLLFRTLAIADVPRDAPGKFKDARYWNRCGSPQGQPDISPEDCREETTKAFKSGCIDQAEYNYATSKGLIVNCIKRTLISACPCACFEESTKIMVNFDSDPSSWKPITEFRNGESIVSLSEESSLDKISPKINSVSYKTQGPERKELYFVKTDLGSLGVTESHAILLADGRMVAAKDLKKSDQLLSVEGDPLPIEAISQIPANGIVHNLLVNSERKKEHVIVAGTARVYVGDLLWQNSLGSELNSVLLRR